jgi:hypothetical protein
VRRPTAPRGHILARCEFDRRRQRRALSRVSEIEHPSMIFFDVRSRAVRQRAGDPGCCEPVPTSILGKNRAEEPAEGRGAFTKLRDDEGVPLICPTCQVLLQASMPAIACYFAWGCFRYF